MLKVKIALALVEFCERHPLLIKCMRPVANVPVIKDRVPLLVRAYMGATSFDLHDVDVNMGRIGIGGVDEIMFGSELLWVLHRILDRLGPEGRDLALYDIGFLTGYYEAKDALRKDKWAPKVFLPLMTEGNLLQRVRSDALMASLFNKVLQMETRIIINEGGWGGVVEFDYSSTPIRAVLANSQESTWLGPAPEPVCSYFAGGAAGHASAITGEWFQGREVECASMGADRCVFEMVPAIETPDELARRSLAEELLELDPSPWHK